MKTQRRAAAAWGMVFGYATLGCSVIRNILLVPIYLKFINVEEYGAWLATGGTLVQLLISDYGVGGVILQRTAATFGAGDKPRLGNVIGTALGSGILLAIALSLLSVALTPFIPHLLDIKGPTSSRVVDCFLLAIIANAISVVATVAANVLRGLQRAIVSGGIQLAAELVLIAVTLVLLYRRAGLYALAWGMIARAVFAAAATTFQTFVISARRLGLRLHFDRVEGTRLLADSTSLSLVSISMRLLTRSDVFLVGSVLGAHSAAIYGLTTRIIDTVTMLLSQINASLAPSVAHLYGQGNYARFRELLNRMLPVLGALSLTGLGAAVAINKDFVSLWVGASLFAGDGLSVLFATAAFVSGLGYIGYDALMAVGQFRFIAATYAIFAIVQVALAVGLLQLGIVGAPLAVIASSLCWGLVFWRRVNRTLPGESMDMRAVIRSLGVSMGVTIAVLVVTGVFVPAATSWPWLAVKALGVATAIACGIAAGSRRIRESAFEEFVATARSLRR